MSEQKPESKMTEEEINVKIAEVCGWKKVQMSAAQTIWFHEEHPPACTDNDSPNKCLPNFCQDLNAMHEAEGILPIEEWRNYIDALEEVVKAHEHSSNMDIINQRLFHATAAQRAEAFLKTLGLWIEEPTSSK